MTTLTPPAWALNGVCASGEHSPELWFADHDSKEQRLAIALCNTCPVKRLCGQRARQLHERHGVWAGKVRGDKRGGAL